MEAKNATGILLGIMWGSLFERYIFAEYYLMLNIVIIVAIDTAFGILKAYKNKTISSKGFGQVITKIAIYMFLMIAANQGFLNAPTTTISEFFKFVSGVIYGTIIAREMLSIIENATLMGFIKLPKSLLSKLSYFDDDGLPGNPKP